MTDIDLRELAKQIKHVFLEQDRYVLAKYVTEFERDGKFGGDFVNFAMIDPTTTPPSFFEVTSPYDLITGKAPQQVLVFRDGKCVLNEDYTEYAAMRTGIMDGVVLAQTQKDKQVNVLLFGSGKTASWSIRGLAALTPWIVQVDYFSKSGAKQSFESLGKEVGIELVYKHDWREQLPSYDVIICHTNTSEPIIITKDKARIKPGAAIHSFLGSTEHGELADELYKGAEIVSDWPKILEDNKILMRNIKGGNIDPNKITYLSKFFSEDYQLKSSVPYTIFQFGGTPLQNLAVLQLLTKT